MAAGADFAESWCSLLELFISVGKIRSGAHEPSSSRAHTHSPAKLPQRQPTHFGPAPLRHRPQNAGLKLRLPILDTVLFKSGRAIGHFYSNKDGVVCKHMLHDITRQTVYQRIAARHVLDPRSNAFGYIAVAHYGSGVSRLLKRPEFQELVGHCTACPANVHLHACIMHTHA